MQIAPASVTLVAGAQQKFVATVTGAADVSVAWSLAETDGGTISADGTYTAPTSAGTFHVVATSAADKTRSAQATIVVTKPPPPPPGISVQIAPASVTLAAGAQQKFVAAVMGAADGSVAWSLVETGGGTISADGTYTAPMSAGTFHVVATSAADKSKSAQATIDVTPPPPPPKTAISPKSATLKTGASLQFTANVPVSWSASGGAIDATGFYTAPQTAGVFQVVATGANGADTADVTVTQACVPRTCGTSCGPVPDGCGGTLDCGACPTGGCSDPSVKPTPVADCREITAPGCYAVSADLRATSTGYCLYVHDTSGVEIAGGNHTVVGQGSGVWVQDASHFSVHDVVLGVNSTALVRNSTDGSIDHDTLPVGLTTVDSARLTIASNTVHGMVYLDYTTASVVRDNVMSLPSPPQGSTAALVWAQYGANNQFLRNTIDGAWDGQNNVGGDDGILLRDERAPVVDSNHIANVWDTGIESLGLLSDGAITNNTIVHAGHSAIGGWYQNNWRNNRVSGNLADGAPYLFLFARFGGLRPAGFDRENKMPADTAIEFHDNLFDHNALRNPVGHLPSAWIPLFGSMDYSSHAGGFDVPGSRDPTSNEWNLQNNTFNSNDFGKATPAPHFGDKPLQGAVVDGGANICGTPNPPYPLKCNP